MITDEFINSLQIIEAQRKQRMKWCTEARFGV